MFEAALTTSGVTNDYLINNTCTKSTEIKQISFYMVKSGGFQSRLSAEIKCFQTSPWLKIIKSIVIRVTINICRRRLLGYLVLTQIRNFAYLSFQSKRLRYFFGIEYPSSSLILLMQNISFKGRQWNQGWFSKVRTQWTSYLMRCRRMPRLRCHGNCGHIGFFKDFWSRSFWSLFWNYFQLHIWHKKKIRNPVSWKC